MIVEITTARAAFRRRRKFPSSRWNLDAVISRVYRVYSDTYTSRMGVEREGGGEADADKGSESPSELSEPETWRGGKLVSPENSSSFLHGGDDVLPREPGYFILVVVVVV